MIIDKLLSPAVSADLSDFTVSTQVIGSGMDLGSVRNNGVYGNASNPGFVLTVRDATSGGSATLNLLFVTDDNEALASTATLWSTGAIALASLDEYQLFVPMPVLDTYQQFIGWKATVGTAVFTGGTLSIEYVADFRQWRAYDAATGR